MKKLSFLILVLVVVSAMMITGCTQTPAPTPSPTPVPTPVPTTIVPATTAPLTDPALTGSWNLMGAMLAGGTPVILNEQLPLTFNSDGTLTGNGGCNSFSASYTLTGGTTEFGKTITISPIITTLKYCADTSDKETQYLGILQDAKTYSITNNKMIIRNSITTQLSYEKA
jgi:heat shock protein HslJ